MPLKNNNWLTLFASQFHRKTSSSTRKSKRNIQSRKQTTERTINTKPKDDFNHEFGIPVEKRGSKKEGKDDFYQNFGIPIEEHRTEKEGKDDFDYDFGILVDEHESKKKGKKMNNSATGIILYSILLTIGVSLHGILSIEGRSISDPSLDFFSGTVVQSSYIHNFVALTQLY